MDRLYKIPLKDELEFLSDEKIKISFRAKTVSSSSIILIFIMGSLSSYVLLYSEVGWKGSLINVPFLAFMIFYYYFQKKYKNNKLSCICVMIGIIYMTFIFSVFYILMFNILLNGIETDQIRLFPALWHILITYFISLILGPFYTNSIIKKKIYKKHNKNQVWLAILASFIGTTVARYFFNNMLLIVMCLFSYWIISLLTMVIVYYLFLYKMLIKHNE